MAITMEKLNETAREMQRLARVMRAAKKRLEEDKRAEYGCPETGAVRRASMDLTRALARLRGAGG